MSGLQQELREALRTIEVGEPPLEQVLRRSRQLAVRRRLAGATVAVTLAVAAAAYPVIGRQAAAPAPVPALHPRPAPRHDPVITDTPAGANAPGGVVARGRIGTASWRVTLAAPAKGGTAGGQSCFTGTVGTSTVTDNCAPLSPGGANPAAFTWTSDRADQVSLAAVAPDVTYLVLTFTDGQQLKLIPVAIGSHRYVAYAAPLDLTVASATAHLGGPNHDNGRTQTAIPFTAAGLPPVFGLWQRPGESAPPRASGVIGAGTTGGQPWSATAHEGPWGTCVVTAPGTSYCVPVRALTRTGVIGGLAERLPGPLFGSAAPGVAYLRITLAQGQPIRVTPAAVGNERLFALWLGPGQLPERWTSYTASGNQLSSGPVS